jgi:hypothetical protein
MLFFNILPPGGGGGGGVMTLSNGLTLTGTNGVLGGTLTGYTEIEQNGQGFQIQDTPNGGIFNLSSGQLTYTSTDSSGLFFDVLFALDTTQVVLQAEKSDGSGDLAKIEFVDSGGFSGVILTNTLNNRGLTGGADFSPNIESFDFTQKVYVDARRNAANFGQVATLADVGHYADPGISDNTYRIGAWAYVDTITGTAALVVQVTFTDNEGNTKTKDFFPQGAVTSSLTVADDYPFPTMDMRVKAGTTMQVSATLSGVGTILYDVGCTIQLLVGA